MKENRPFREMVAERVAMSVEALRDDGCGNGDADQGDWQGPVDDGQANSPVDMRPVRKSAECWDVTPTVDRIGSSYREFVKTGEMPAFGDMLAKGRYSQQVKEKRRAEGKADYDPHADADALVPQRPDSVEEIGYRRSEGQKPGTPTGVAGNYSWPRLFDKKTIDDLGLDMNDFDLVGVDQYVPKKFAREVKTDNLGYKYTPYPMRPYKRGGTDSPEFTGQGAVDSANMRAKDTSIAAIERMHESRAEPGFKAEARNKKYEAAYEARKKNDPEFAERLAEQSRKAEESRAKWKQKNENKQPSGDRDPDDGPKDASSIEKAVNRTQREKANKAYMQELRARAAGGDPVAIKEIKYREAGFSAKKAHEMAAEKGMYYHVGRETAGEGAPKAPESRAEMRAAAYEWLYYTNPDLSDRDIDAIEEIRVSDPDRLIDMIGGPTSQNMVDAISNYREFTSADQDKRDKAMDNWWSVRNAARDAALSEPEEVRERKKQEQNEKEWGGENKDKVGWRYAPHTGRAKYDWGDRSWKGKRLNDFNVWDWYELWDSDYHKPNPDGSQDETFNWEEATGFRRPVQRRAASWYHGQGPLETQALVRPSYRREDGTFGIELDPNHINNEDPSIPYRAAKGAIAREKQERLEAQTPAPAVPKIQTPTERTGGIRTTLTSGAPGPTPEYDTFEDKVESAPTQTDDSMKGDGTGPKGTGRTGTGAAGVGDDGTSKKKEPVEERKMNEPESMAKSESTSFRDMLTKARIKKDEDRGLPGGVGTVVMADSVPVRDMWRTVILGEDRDVPIKDVPKPAPGLKYERRRDAETI